MFARTTAAALLCLGLCQPAQADRFYFGDPKTAEQMAGQPDVIEGVLIKEDKDTYTIRVLYGEITVPKAMVYKVEKTALTVAELEKREQARARDLAQANSRRRELQAAAASARREARARAAAARRPQRELRVDVDFQKLLPNYRFRTFDPVLDRIDLTGLQNVIHAYLLQEAERATHRRR